MWSIHKSLRRRIIKHGYLVSPHVPRPSAALPATSAGFQIYVFIYSHLPHFSLRSPFAHPSFSHSGNDAVIYSHLEGNQCLAAGLRPAVPIKSIFFILHPSAFILSSNPFYSRLTPTIRALPLSVMQPAAQNHLLHPFQIIAARKSFTYREPHGRVAEWSIAPVLKTGEPKGSVGSNPTPSAISQHAAFAP
jgi:hypothetical protein